MVFLSSIAVLMIVDESSFRWSWWQSSFGFLLWGIWFPASEIQRGRNCFSSWDFFTINICSRKKDFNASISEFNRMIWSLKSHTQMLLSIELEVSSCSRAIGSYSLERWISDGVSVKILCCGEEICSTSMWFQH